MKTTLIWAAAAALTLAACGRSEPAADAGVAEPSSRTLAASLDENDDLDSLEAVIEAAGLQTVLEGVGPYTIFAPTDAAFTAAGGAPGEDEKAQGATLVRAHIVPGVVTRADISAALDRAADGKVTLRTMDDGVLTFTREGQTIRATAADGAAAALTGTETAASNGVIQPIDGVLVKGE
ncbi:fasciclin domain-containing protein [Brevundimonas sp. FT23042]|uniref:fasciclin domain-containing protein n=1 Tax=Brevundimonas sp. FT23042 TaxID=3393749 RepID=UPI003B58ABEC